MRLCITRPPATRTWTVELRPQPQGPLLTCTQCNLRPETVQGNTARSAALAHLARHARHSLLPQHLRTCQCHERGCRWHPRHRGCNGPLLLVLSRERGGRLWRLADTCMACARAIPDASVVPETALSNPASGPSPRLRRRSTVTRHDGAERVLVCDMLSYLATSLPQGLSAEARVLALQCTLRSASSGLVHLPPGLTRGLAVHKPRLRWEELESAGWLYLSSGSAAWLVDPLLGTLGRRRRARAGDWALRAFRTHSDRQFSAYVRLVAMALIAHTSPGEPDGAADMIQLARRCGLPPAIQLLVEHCALAAWTFDHQTGDLVWMAAPAIE